MNSKTSIAALVFVAAFIGFSLPAAAQDTGVYVGAQIGAAKAKNICGGANACDQDETGYKGFVGYQVMKYLSAEGGFQYFGMFGRDGAGISVQAFDLLAVGTYPVWDALSVYGRAGLYYASTKSKPLSNDNSGFTYSVGAEWGFSKELSGRLDWQRYNNVGGGDFGSTTDVDVLSVGLVWRPK